MKNKWLKNKWLVVLLLAALAAGGFYGYKVIAARQAAAAVTRQTSTIALGSVSETINGVGTVRSKQSAAINWQTSGKVSEVLVEIGQAVKADEVLAALEATSLSTSIIQAQAELISAQNDLEDLQTPNPLKIAEARKALTTAQSDLEDLLNPTAEVILAAEQAVITAQAAVDDAQYDVSSLLNGRGDTEQIELARADYLMAQDRLEVVQSIYDQTDGDPAVDAIKAVALSNLAAAETARDRALGILNWYLGSPSEEEIAEANLALSLAQAQLASAQEKLDNLRAPTEEDLALAQAVVADAEETLAAAKAGATEEELIIAQTRVDVAQSTLDQARLAAPFDGIITNVNVLPGDLVSQGKEAFTIHDFSMLFVDISISELDISQVEVGQPVTFTFDAISDKEYSGVVTKISLSATSSMGVVNYPVTVQITNPDEEILPGMTASVNIIIEKHENVLVVPSSAVRTSGGQRTVTILFEGNEISVPVTVGLTSDAMTEISSTQLREGDTVILNVGTSGVTSAQQTGGGFIGGFEMGAGGVPPAGGGMLP
jgi:HlyD family secretion protein